MEHRSSSPAFFASVDGIDLDRPFRKNLAKTFPSIHGEGVPDVLAQRPHPYAEMLRTEASEGRALVAQIILSACWAFLSELAS
jgi:hypothetical protein